MTWRAGGLLALAFVGVGTLTAIVVARGGGGSSVRSTYRGKSPQGFPLAADRPGCGPETNCLVS